jgi:GNAT superfamily N-acetyltransferase
LSADAGYVVSSDTARVDVPLVHRWLSSESYWARGVPLDVVKKSVENSICFSVHHEPDGQVGFARVVTDRATFAYLADVFVLAPHRGRGVSRRMMEAVLSHPELQGLRRWLLATRDAHDLYARFGFVPPTPGRLMERVVPDIYLKR